MLLSFLKLIYSVQSYAFGIIRDNFEEIEYMIDYFFFGVLLHIPSSLFLCKLISLFLSLSLSKLTYSVQSYACWQKLGVSTDNFEEIEYMIDLFFGFLLPALVCGLFKIGPLNPK